MSCPKCLRRFEVLDKVGEGSFGTVWTAKEHDKEASEPLLALKRINLTCSPSRILNEFEQMRKLGGERVEMFGRNFFSIFFIIYMADETVAVLTSASMSSFGFPHQLIVVGTKMYRSAAYVHGRAQRVEYGGRFHFSTQASG